MRKLLFLLLLCLGAGLTLEAQTAVARHGQLRVSGKKIKDECDRDVQLRGMSYFWSQWEGNRFFNADVVKWLRDDWKVNVVRIPLGCNNSNRDNVPDHIYEVRNLSTRNNKNRVKAVVDGAIQHGIYAVIDWHAHPEYRSEAVDFFSEMAQTYGDNPNVIYEIWNEPIGPSDLGEAQDYWDNTLKPYHERVIAAIRDHDPDNIIVVGTPFYDQYLSTAANNPITQDSKGRSVSNIAYTLHFYAAQHKQAIRDQAQAALDANLAVWVTECGRVGTAFDSNDNPIDQDSWNTWEAWLDARKITWTKWSLSDKSESSSGLKPSAPSDGGWDPTDHLTAEGRWSRNKLRNKNANPASVCDDDSGGGSDLINSITAPNSIRRGGQATVTIEYEASAERDIRIAFQKNSSPYTTYFQRRLNVSAGSGTRSTTFTVPNDVPLGNDAAQWQVYITTDGGGWAARFSNRRQNNVDVLAASTNVYDAIYTDNFRNGWRNWSWGGTATVRDGGVKRFGNYSFKFQYNGGGGAVSFQHPDGKPADNLKAIEFWARSWDTNFNVNVSGSYDNNAGNASSPKRIAVTPTWKKFTVTKAELGNYGWYRRFFFRSGTNRTLFLDNVRLVYNNSVGQETYTDVHLGDDQDLLGLDNDLAEPTADVFPNPGDGRMTLDLQLPASPGELTLQVLDANGRAVVDQRSADLTAGRHRLMLDFRRELRPGLYFLRLTNADGAVNLVKRITVR